MLDNQFEPFPSKPLRRLSLGAKKSGKPASADDEGGDHFVAPWRLTEQEKSAVSAALEKRKIGDALGRRIFVGALEYELSEFRVAEAAQPGSKPARKPAAPQADASVLEAIERMARELAAKLGEIPEDQEPSLLATLEAHDEMGRGYSTRYLDVLFQEASRLAEACGLAASALAAPVEPPKTEPAPGPSPAMLKLLGSLTHVFEECFEQVPTASPRGEFAASLKAVSDAVGLDIPRTGEVLAQVVKTRQR